MSASSADVVVVGAGFGGLGAALTLAEQGADVVLCETLNYPGGCASTFQRQGHRFEAGATLFSGFGAGQLMDRWVNRHALPVQFEAIDPLVEFRTSAWRLAVPRDRVAMVARFAALPGAPTDQLLAFFAFQERVADTLWALFDDPTLLPPFNVSAALTHLRRTPAYLPLLRWIGRPVLDVLRHHGLQDFEPLRTWLDAACQITVQASAAEAEAVFALAAVDYFFRGTGHVRGGIGELAWALSGAIEQAGGRVSMGDRVTGLGRAGQEWHVETRKGRFRAPAVIANLLPHGVRSLTGLAPGDHPALDRQARRVEQGWGAVMLYLALDPGADLPASPHHLELVVDPSRPLVDGNHVFASVSGAQETDRGPDGERTVTVSTHVDLSRLRSLPADEQVATISGVQLHMRDALRALAPELWRAVRLEITASPRTFERFTRRHAGYVGGIPRRAGLDNYRSLVPQPVLPGLWMVGDTVFPGQSTLGVALGGLKLAHHVLASLDRPAGPLRLPVEGAA